MGATAGVLLDRSLLLGYLPIEKVQPDAQSYFELIAEAWNLIEKNFVDRASIIPQKMTYGAIQGMVETLGDTNHSRFLTPEMVKEDRQLTTGEFEGVGLEVQNKDGQVVIVAPIDDSPAQKAGLKAGQIITKVDGKDISGMQLSDVTSLIMGPSGTKVTLTIFDPVSGSTDDVELKRSKIAIKNVEWSQIPGTKIADIRLSAFSQGVSIDLQKALKEIENQGMEGIILDLRNNPGGLLDEAVSVASQFLPSGNVLISRDARGNDTPFPVRKGTPTTNLPLVVLVNNGTASAAEIVTAALQESKRATVIGEKTFGTGTVLNQFLLSDGSAIFLATEEWLTPSGKTIWHEGIEPGIEVTLSPDAMMLFPRELSQMSAEEVQKSQDIQFLKGLSLLEQPVPPQSTT